MIWSLFSLLGWYFFLSPNHDVKMKKKKNLHGLIVFHWLLGQLLSRSDDPLIYHLKLNKNNNIEAYLHRIFTAQKPYIQFRTMHLATWMSIKTNNLKMYVWVYLKWISLVVNPQCPAYGLLPLHGHSNIKSKIVFFRNKSIKHQLGH